MQISDEALLKGCRDGRKDAWDAFVDRYSKLIYWSLHRTFETSSYSARTGLIEELFQEVFTKILEPGEMDRIRDSHAVAKYLTVLTARKALDRIRSMKREEKTVSSHEELIEAAPVSVLEGLDEGNTALIRETMNDLKSQERFCLEMHYVDGKTHREIAEFMGLPQDTVSTLIRRTREKLKEKLSKKGF